MEVEMGRKRKMIKSGKGAKTVIGQIRKSLTGDGRRTIMSKPFF